MNLMFVLGGVVGWVLASTMAGRALPALSVQTFAAVFVGGVAAQLASFALVARRESRSSPQVPHVPPLPPRMWSITYTLAAVVCGGIGALMLAGIWIVIFVEPADTPGVTAYLAIMTGVIAAAFMAAALTLWRRAVRFRSNRDQ